MVETYVSDLDGEEFRYGGDSWALTGDIDVRRNGERITADARKTERVRKDAATMQFELQDPPASLNPGNLGEFTAELKPLEDAVYLIVVRSHATNHYRLESMNYQ